MNFHDTEGPVYLMDTGKIQTHTPQHLNPHPMGGNQPPWNLTIPEAKPIPLLMLQTDTTKVTKMTTPNQAVQTNLEDPEALTDPGVWVAPVGLEVLEVPMVLEALEVPADLAPTPPTSKTSCGNS